MGKPLPVGKKRCKQCHEIKDATLDFLPVRSRDHDNLFCYSCAQSNMRKYDRTSRADLTDFNKIKVIED